MIFNLLGWETQFNGHFTPTSVGTESKQPRQHLLQLGWGLKLFLLLSTYNAWRQGHAPIYDTGKQKKYFSLFVWIAKEISVSNWNRPRNTRNHFPGTAAISYFNTMRGGVLKTRESVRRINPHIFQTSMWMESHMTTLHLHQSIMCSGYSMFRLYLYETLISAVRRFWFQGSS